METEHAHPQDDKGQGDILVLEYPDGETGPRLGVLINADCDLAHGKTDGTIAYLPMYTFREYLELFWLPAYLTNVAGESTKRIVELVDAGEGGAGDLEILLDRFSEQEATARLCRMPGVGRKAVAEIASHVARVAMVRDAARSAYGRFEGICGLHKDPRKLARSQIERAYRDMSDGHLFISDLATRPEIGFVIRMRRIHSMPEDRVFTSASAQKAGSDGTYITAARIARLSPQYRYKLLQLFAQQFSRIGLDDEITALSSLAIDDLIANIGAT